MEAAWSLGPSNPLFMKGIPLWTLIHERYRNPAGYTGNRHYETNGWFFVADSIMNLAKNRYVITMPLMGLPVSAQTMAANGLCAVAGCLMLEVHRHGSNVSFNIHGNICTACRLRAGSRILKAMA